MIELYHSFGIPASMEVNSLMKSKEIRFNKSQRA